MSTQKTTMRKLTLPTMTTILLLVIGSVISLSTFAYDNNDEEILSQKLDMISLMGKEADFSQMSELLPPKIIVFLSDKMQISPEAFKLKIAQMANNFLENTTDIEYITYLDQAKVLKSEINRDYVIIPTMMNMRIDGKKVSVSGHLLAIKENGEWYIMRVDGPQHLNIVQAVYPDIVHIPLFEQPAELRYQ